MKKRIVPDIHWFTAKLLYGVEPNVFLKPLRTNAKQVFYSGGYPFRTRPGFGVMMTPVTTVMSSIDDEIFDLVRKDN